MGDNCSKLKQARFEPHISEKCFFTMKRQAENRLPGEVVSHLSSEDRDI